MPKNYKCSDCEKIFDEPKIVIETYTVPRRVSGSGMAPGEYTDEYKACPYCGEKWLYEWFEGWVDSLGIV